MLPCSFSLEVARLATPRRLPRYTSISLPQRFLAQLTSNLHHQFLAQPNNMLRPADQHAKPFIYLFIYVKRMRTTNMAAFREVLLPLNSFI
ncbi:hypothetical protein ERO13_A10G104201v2 [Gossypium hirsutum]|uniref:Uncharacterized protein n=2 Tax=Gossypium TaxID=3633 RepID=A0A5D2NP57_GOSTO|nr:hypothetical protein ERO13_A10G104201v2 [Gossypium hirsutum]TYG98517.1 hypothetical protein ES288_A10G123300v1 [Gossypium darwinii]TYI05928.1 hypothetical protein ES332_A10G123100v1 [Gossypium tomentosum]